MAVGLKQNFIQTYATLILQDHHYDHVIQRTDGDMEGCLCIPINDEGNRDYQEYLAWKAEGNDT